MADLSALGTLRPVEPLDLEAYQDNQASPPLPKKGRYVVQAPDSFPATAFGRTEKGNFSARVDPTIIGPNNEGYIIRFTSVSGKVYQRAGKAASQVGDYLRALGFRQGKLTDEQALADAIEQTANLTYEVELDWRAYNKKTKRQYEGMELFPSDGNGGHSPWLEDKNDVDEDGNHPSLRANVFVKRFIPVSASD